MKFKVKRSLVSAYGVFDKTGVYESTDYPVAFYQSLLDSKIAETDFYGDDVEDLKGKVGNVDITTLATKSFVTEEIVKVNTGGAVDLSSKADISYVDQKLPSFGSLAELQAAHPNGLTRPVWIRSEKMWYMWVAEEYMSYLSITNSMSNSTTAYWKGTVMNVKQDITLTEVGAVGIPEQWHLWSMTVDGKLGTMLSSGTFTGTIDNKDIYNPYRLSSPVELLAGKDYILIVKYGGSSYYATGEALGVDDAYVNMQLGTYNLATTPVAGVTVPTANTFIYRHYIKYEV